jgi:hypothetical protein
VWPSSQQCDDRHRHRTRCPERSKPGRADEHANDQPVPAGPGALLPERRQPRCACCAPQLLRSARRRHRRQRRFVGKAAIRTWARNEFIGGRLTIIRRVARPRNRNGLTLQVRFAPGGSGGFLAHYRFVTRNGKLVLVDMQYPN